MRNIDQDPHRFHPQGEQILLCFQVLSNPGFLLIFLCEKEITEMNLDIDHVSEFIFLHFNMIFYIGWD